MKLYNLKKHLLDMAEYFILFKNAKKEDIGKVYVKQLQKLFKAKNDALEFGKLANLTFDPIPNVLNQNIIAFNQSKLGKNKETEKIFKESNFKLFNKGGTLIAEFKNIKNHIIKDSDLFGGLVSAITSFATIELNTQFNEITMQSQNGEKVAIIVGNYLMISFVWVKDSPYSFNKVLRIATKFLEYCEKDMEKMFQLHNKISRIIDLEKII